MKVAILAGGLGTRLSEETTIKPKPMVEIGGYPILWHIMQIYASYGYKEFVVALGYKGEVIKDYFLHYHHRSQSLSVCLETGMVTVHGKSRTDWKVHLLDTGLHTQTGGRIKKLSEFIGNERFMLTYGDGVCNLNIRQLERFHQEHGKLATVTAVRPPARFGSISFNGNFVAHFEEKSQVGDGWINGGFFVLDPEIVKYIESDATLWERQPLECLAADEQLVAFRHSDFWQCMDTMRDVSYLESLWRDGNAPWKVWP